VQALQRPLHAREDRRQLVVARPQHREGQLERLQGRVSEITQGQ
jgi:hypothetical protein